MKKLIKNTVKFILFPLAGIVLFYFVYKDFNFREDILNKLKDVNYWWFLLAFIVCILCQASRAIRWQYLLEADGEKVGFKNTFLSILNCYFVNIAVPRMGEVTRCAIISRYEKQKLSKVLGTMVTERLIDALCLALLFIIVFFLQSTTIINSIFDKTAIIEKFSWLLSTKMIITIIFILLSLLILSYLTVKGKFDKIKIFQRISIFIRNLWLGIISIMKTKKLFGFIFHSLLIWICYILMFYFFFLAFEDISKLGFLISLTVFLASALAMLFPAPGGIGAFHFMVTNALGFFLIAEGLASEEALANAAAFAFIAHAMQTLYIVVGGIFSFIAIPLVNKK